MNGSYYGLICRHCGQKYPLGEENSREFKHLLNWGPFELQCFRCGHVDVYDRYENWLTEEKYPFPQIATAKLRVRRADRDATDKNCI